MVIKKGRVGIRMDMTPMVDVAFLLLTFFMLTTQFKPTEEMQIDLPASHSQFKLPDSDVMNVSIGQDGRILLGVDSQTLREKLFGSDFKLKASAEVKKEELGELLIKARILNPKLRTVIKGDKRAPYGLVEDVISMLLKAKINVFNLVTELDKS